MTDPNVQPSTGPSSTKKMRSRVFAVLRVVVSVGLLVAVVRGMGLEETMDALRSTSLPWVLAVLALMFVGVLHSAYKWQILLRHTDSSVKFWPLFRIIYVSYFVGMFLPGAVGIELVRMYGLAKHTSNLAMSFTSILMDRLLGLTGLTLMILLGVFIQGRSTIPGIEYWAAGALALILAGWLAIMNRGFRRLTDKILSPPILAMVRDKQTKIYASLDTYRNRPGLLAWAMLQSLLYNVQRIAVCYVAGLAVGMEVSVTAYIITVPVVTFAMLIPISISGWGVRELLFVQMLTLYGADGDKALAMSLLVGVLGTVSIIPGVWFCIQGLGQARAAARTQQPRQGQAEPITPADPAP